MERLLKDLDKRWQEKGHGILLGTDCSSQLKLTHVIFVDDVAFVAKSFSQLADMILDLRAKLQQWGLTLHPSECTAQANDADWYSRAHVHICEGMTLKILTKARGSKSWVHWCAMVPSRLLQ